MALDTHACVCNCTCCAKERISLRSHSQFLKLFPAARPLEFVALDILGPLTKTAQCNRFLLVISDRYSKLTKSVPLTAIFAYRLVRAFCENWVFVHGPLGYSRTTGHSSPPSSSSMCVISWESGYYTYTTTYHP